MIRIKTPGPSGPEYDRWKRRAEVARDQCLEDWKAGRTPHLQESVWQSFKKIFLCHVFHDKCAYCEVSCAGHLASVEHYRPKAMVTEGGQKIDHPGYFWLSYEWYNLLLSCSACNSSAGYNAREGRCSHPGKRSEFLIRGCRIVRPSDDPGKWIAELSAEKPLLLNPYFDDPKPHLEYRKDGSIVSNTPEGRATIEICRLDRLSLADKRREIAQNAEYRIVNFVISGRKDLFAGPEIELSACVNFNISKLISALAEEDVNHSKAVD